MKYGMIPFLSLIWAVLMCVHFVISLVLQKYQA